MALSIKQTAKNYTVYPEVPLDVQLQSGTTAQSLLVVFVFAQQTGSYQNYAQLAPETAPPLVYTDKGDLLTQTDQVLNIPQEVGYASFSPPDPNAIASPDASWNFPSVYLFTGAPTAGAKHVYIVDGGLGNTSPAMSSPPEADWPAGRPVFDGGIKAFAFEVAGKYSGTGQTAVDKHGTVSGNSTTIGAGLFTPTNDDELVLEAGVLLDSSAIGLGTGATYQHSADYPAGSSSYLVQSTLQSTKAANAGFSNPIDYAGAAIAVALD